MASRQRKDRRKGQPPLAEPKGFSSLSKAEQVRYLEALWDSISARPGEIPCPSRTSSLLKSGLPSIAEIPAALAPPVMSSIV